MQVQHARTAEELVSRLTSAWSGPRPDPFAFDLAVVPGAGFQRWLSQQLALSDAGICAGVEFVSLPAFERRLGGTDDPWQPDRLVWRVQRLALEPDLPELETLRRHLLASRESYTACNRIARHFAGYARHRPKLLAAWTRGEDAAPDGQPLGDDAWQAQLWRRLVAEIGESPLDRRLALLNRLRSGPTPGLPERIAVIVPTQFHAGLLELLEAVGSHHRVELLALCPTPSRRPARVTAELRRADFTRPVGHRLNLSLGQLGDEAAALFPPVTSTTAPESIPSLLGWLQANLRDDTEAAPRALDPSDDSVQVHLSHDLSRQVEVLREVLTSVLAADPSLEPRDIAVITPDVDAVAPLIGAAFTVAGGPSHPATRFRVQLADRSVAQVNPMATLLLRLLALPDGRFEASTLLELCQEPAIAARFGFGPDARERLVRLVETAGIRWGLSAQQRAGFGLGGFPHNTWFAGLQRMLLGVALPETDLVAAGTVLPLDDVESSDVALIGGLTEFVGRLSRALNELSATGTLAEWCARSRSLLESVVSLPHGQEWQLSDLWTGLSRLAERGEQPGAPLTRAAAERAIADEFAGAPARGAFGNGSLIVCGPNSLRHVPHRVLVLLGWDADRYPRPVRRHGDDLLGQEPRVGDPSGALLDRQLLLDAVHAARQQLIVVAQGRSVATNEVVPLAAPIAELVAALDATAVTAAGLGAGAAVTVQHPLQSFDARYFGGDARLYSADPLAFRAARASVAEPEAPRPRYYLETLPPPDLSQGVTLEQVTDFFKHPARALLKVRAGLSLGNSAESSDELPIELDHLERWQIGNRVLQRLRAGHDADAVRRAEWLRGEVPPFELGRQLMTEVVQEAERSRRQLPSDLADARLHDLEVLVPVPGVGDVKLVGRVRAHGSQLVQAEFSSLAPRHRLEAWIRLLALAAAIPGEWSARVIGKGKVATYAAPPQPGALTILGKLLAIYSRGLSEPLPAFPRVCMEWSSLRESRRDPLDPKVGMNRLRDRWKWETDEAWALFFEFPELVSTELGDREIPGADPSERLLLGALASAIWAPLLAAEVTR